MTEYMGGEASQCFVSAVDYAKHFIGSRMEMSEQISELATALAKAQAEIEGAKRDGINPHFRSSYPTLGSVWDACREPLSKHGLSVVQGASANGADVTVTTILLHASGQWIRDVLTMVAADHKPQSVGSALSYGRRYSLSAMVGIAPDDDDAEAAEGRNRPQAVPFRGGTGGNAQAVDSRTGAGGSGYSTPATIREDREKPVARPGGDQPGTVPDLEVDRPEGAFRIVRVGPGRASAAGEITLDTGESFLCWKKPLITSAELWMERGTWVMVEFKTSASGNTRIENMTLADIPLDDSMPIEDGNDSPF